MKATVSDKNKVTIADSNTRVVAQLTLTKPQKANSLEIGTVITIEVKQLKKDGTINQVGWVEK